MPKRSLGEQDASSEQAVQEETEDLEAERSSADAAPMSGAGQEGLAFANKAEAEGEGMVQVLVSCGDIERNSDLGFAMAIVDPKTGEVLDCNSAARCPSTATLELR